MQLYDRGIRRRLAPMLGDTSLINLACSVLTVYNFSAEPQQCQLRSTFKTGLTMTNLFDKTNNTIGENGAVSINLAGYGSAWYHLRK